VLCRVPFPLNYHLLADTGGVTHLRPWIFGALLALGAAVACGGNGDPAGTGTPLPTAPAVAAVPRSATVNVALQTVLDGFDSPTSVRSAGDGSGLLFVTEQRGRVYAVDTATARKTLFLDISPRTTASGEQGLLGIAFHPGFPENGRFFVTYTASGDGAITLAEYRLDPSDPSIADPLSGRVLLAIPKAYTNHNGGAVAFGPDGYLYLSTGDGGGAGDPDGNAQDLQSLLGKLLRLDVDGDGPYAIPPGNPYLTDLSARDEIWASGLRNAWRFSFDRLTGDLWIADVGQDVREEVNFVLAGTPGGLNFGWNVFEGTLCFPADVPCALRGHHPPLYEYQTGEGACSVIGGYVYRGEAIPTLAGRYVFTDFCAGILVALTPQPDGSWEPRLVGVADAYISAFGEDDDGELYALNHASGTLSRLVPVE
jgi:glucose/arabinose dehydrogenase